MVTLNEWTGEVMRAETFLTWQPETSRQVVQALQDVGAGRLLVFVGLVGVVRNATGVLGGPSRPPFRKHSEA